LLDASGNPLPNGEYQLSFSIYDAATAGGLVWGPQVFDGSASPGHGSRIPVVNGYFNVILGPDDTNGVPITSAFNGTSRYFEIRVSSNPPISPRQRILSAPFALKAADTDKLGGTNWAAVFDNGNPASGKIPGALIANTSISSAQLANKAVGALQIADGAIGAAQIGNGAIRSNHVAAGAISSSHVSNLNRLTRQNATNTAVFVNSSGYVGIGTSSPGASLDIRGMQTDGRNSVIIGGNEAEINIHSGNPLGIAPYPPGPSLVFTADWGVGIYLPKAAIRLSGWYLQLDALTRITGGLLVEGNLWVTNVPSGSGTPLLITTSGSKIVKQTSSRRYKENIQPYHGDAYRILGLEPKKYTRPDTPQQWELGYIAEEVDQAGLRELTIYDEKGLPEAIDYDKIVLFSNEIIKDQQARLASQQHQIDSLKGELDALRQMISELKRERP
jgi:hypothetical protein